MNFCFLEFVGIPIHIEIGWNGSLRKCKYTSNATFLVIKTLEMKSVGKQFEF